MISQPSFPRTVFLIEQEPCIATWIGETLATHGLQARPLATLVDVIKAARTEMPAAVIIDLSSAGAAHDPHARMGPDHMMRVLRQTYPDLCFVAITAHTNRQMEIISRELQVPLLRKPFGSAELVSVLKGCGTIASAAVRPFDGNRFVRSDALIDQAGG